jgi:hypothetical protein
VGQRRNALPLKARPAGRLVAVSRSGNGLDKAKQRLVGWNALSGMAIPAAP